MLITEKYFDEKIIPILRGQNKNTGQQIKSQKGAYILNEVFKCAENRKESFQPFKEIAYKERQTYIAAIRRWRHTGLFEKLAILLPELSKYCRNTLSAFEANKHSKFKNSYPRYTKKPPAPLPRYVALAKNPKDMKEIWALAKELIDLKPHECKYPIGSTFCKKDRTDGSPYCRTHAKQTRLEDSSLKGTCSQF